MTDPELGSRWRVSSAGLVVPAAAGAHEMGVGRKETPAVSVWAPALFAAVPAVVAVVRVGIMSGGTYEVLTILLQTLDIQALVLSTYLVSAWPMSMTATVLVGYVLARRVVLQRIGFLGRLKNGAFVAQLAVIAILISPASLEAVVGTTLVGLFMVLWTMMAGGQRLLSAATRFGVARVDAMMRAGVWLLAGWLVALFLALSVIAPPWLPMEAVRLGDASHAWIVGYVLRNTDAETTVLGADGAVYRGPAGVLAYRRVCPFGERKLVVNVLAPSLTTVKMAGYPGSGMTSAHVESSDESIAMVMCDWYVDWWRSGRFD